MNLTLVNKGVSDKDKRVKIFRCRNNSGGSSINKNKFKVLNEKYDSVDYIDCISLKHIFDKFNIKRCDFLKIDCEGEESKILTGLPDKYFMKIEKIVLEYHPTVDEIKLARFLVKKGYKVTITNFGSKLGMIFAKRKPKESLKEGLLD